MLTDWNLLEFADHKNNAVKRIRSNAPEGVGVWRFNHSATKTYFQAVHRELQNTLLSFISDKFSSEMFRISDRIINVLLLW